MTIRRHSINISKMKRQLIEWFGTTCWDCKTDKGYVELDHILPLADGGDNCSSNFQLLCRECHKEKTSSEAKARNKFKIYTTIVMDQNGKIISRTEKFGR